MFQYTLFEKYLSHFFKVHPYGQQSTVGTIESLKNPSLTRMYNFFKTYYVANNMALVLSGDFILKKLYLSSNKNLVCFLPELYLKTNNLKKSR